MCYRQYLGIFYKKNIKISIQWMVTSKMEAVFWIGIVTSTILPYLVYDRTRYAKVITDGNLITINILSSVLCQNNVCAIIWRKAVHMYSVLAIYQ